MKLRVTVCQLDNRLEHRAAVLVELGKHVRDSRAELVVLPELPFSSWLAAAPAGEPAHDAARWQRSVADHQTGIDQLSELGAAAVIGSRPTLDATGSRHNQAFTWTPARGAARVRDKHYLPDEEGFWESSWYDRGALDFPTVRELNARIGILLCTELWFFEWARHYGRSRAELLCVPRATPVDSLSRWLAGGQVAASCAGAYCLSSNQWTPSGSGLDCGGLGWVIDPDGVVLATTTAAEPFITVEVDLDLARQAKRTYPRYVVE